MLVVHSGNKAFVCIAGAGGGGHAISALASTPGASALFLGGVVVAYDRNLMHVFADTKRFLKIKSSYRTNQQPLTVPC